MKLPGGMGKARIGRIPAAPLHTDVGAIQVDALGLLCECRYGGLRLLRPYQVTVQRPDGRVEWVPVGDITGRAVLALAAAGLFTAAICHKIIDKWGRHA